MIARMKKLLHAHHPFRIFLVSALLTIGLGAWTAHNKGLEALWLFVVLVLLEVTFSFDNAVINSRILARMSKFWQTMFLTVGIITAVFVVRFILPIVIVMLSSQHDFMSVLHMALHQPAAYSATLHSAAPIINAFGGTFLLMIGISYFMDRNKDLYWLKRIEKMMSRFGRYEVFKVFVMLLVAMGLYATADQAHREAILAASVLGTLVHLALELFGDYFSARQSHAKVLTGMAAFVSFVYLDILDASFSLDGVIGAFAITNDVTSMRVALRSEMSARAVSAMISAGVAALLATGQVQEMSPTVRKRTDNSSICSPSRGGVSSVTGTKRPLRHTTWRRWA